MSSLPSGAVCADDIALARSPAGHLLGLGWPSGVVVALSKKRADQLGAALKKLPADQDRTVLVDLRSPLGGWHSRPSVGTLEGLGASAVLFYDQVERTAVALAFTGKLSPSSFAGQMWLELRIDREDDPS